MDIFKSIGNLVSSPFSSNAFPPAESSSSPTNRSSKPSDATSSSKKESKKKDKDDSSAKKSNPDSTKASSSGSKKRSSSNGSDKKHEMSTGKEDGGTDKDHSSIVDSVGDVFGRIGRSLSFKKDPSPAKGDEGATAGGRKLPPKKAASAAHLLQPSPVFDKFEKPTEGEAAAQRPSVPPSPQMPSYPLGTSGPRSFGSVPTRITAQQSTAPSFEDASPTQNSSFSSIAAGVAPASKPSPAMIGGASKVKYQSTHTIQGSVIHFYVVAVEDMSTGSSKCLALIGLLDAAGSVKASTRATISRCEQMRVLEFVKISPREKDVSLSSVFSESDQSLVDPQNAPILGMIIPYLRSLKGVSAVDGYRTDYWVAADASGAHRAPLFDMEGPVDETNRMVTLRLRCQALRREELSNAAMTVTVDVSSQTLQEAKSLFQSDYDEELNKIQTQYKREVEVLRSEMQQLKSQLAWRKEEYKALVERSTAREEAMAAELADLRRQIQMKISATQTSRPSSRTPSEVEGEAQQGPQVHRQPETSVETIASRSSVIVPTPSSAAAPVSQAQKSNANSTTTADDAKKLKPNKNIDAKPKNNDDDTSSSVRGGAEHKVPHEPHHGEGKGAKAKTQSIASDRRSPDRISVASSAREGHQEHNAVGRPSVALTVESLVASSPQTINTDEKVRRYQTETLMQSSRQGLPIGASGVPSALGGERGGNAAIDSLARIREKLQKSEEYLQKAKSSSSNQYSSPPPPLVGASEPLPSRQLFASAQRTNAQQPTTASSLREALSVTSKVVHVDLSRQRR